MGKSMPSFGDGFFEDDVQPVPVPPPDTSATPASSDTRLAAESSGKKIDLGVMLAIQYQKEADALEILKAQFCHAISKARAAVDKFNAESNDGFGASSTE